MNRSINDGGPVHPVSLEIFNGTGLCGMSLRDLFAGQALASSFGEAVKLIPTKISAEDYALSLYGIADAMLAARNQRP